MKFKQTHITVHEGRQPFTDAIAAVVSGDTTLDFSGVQRVDSAAVAVLLEARRHCPVSKTLKVVSAPPALQGLVAIYGLQSLLSETFA